MSDSPPMSDPLSLPRRFVEEVLSRGDLEVAEQILADGFVEHLPWTSRDKAGFLDGFPGVRTSFPDAVYVLEDPASDGDHVYGRVTMTATHGGDFLGIPPTGRRVTVPQILMWRLDGGRIAELWTSLDRLGVTQQLQA